MNFSTIILFFIAGAGLYFLITTGEGIQPGWRRDFRRETHGWKRAYTTNAPFAGSSNPG